MGCEWKEEAVIDELNVLKNSNGRHETQKLAIIAKQNRQFYRTYIKNFHFLYPISDNECQKMSKS